MPFRNILFAIAASMCLAGCYEPSDCIEPQIRRYWEWNNGNSGPINAMRFSEITKDSIRHRQFIINERDSFLIDVTANFINHTRSCEVYAEVIREIYECESCRHRILVDRRAGEHPSYDRSILLMLLDTDGIIDSSRLKLKSIITDDTLWAGRFGYIEGVGLLKYNGDSLKLLRR